MPHAERYFRRKNRSKRTDAFGWNNLGALFKHIDKRLYELNNQAAIVARQRLLKRQDFWDKLDHRKQWRDLRKQMLKESFHEYLGLNEPYGPVEPLDPVKPKAPTKPKTPTEPSVWTVKKGIYKGSYLYNAAKDDYVLPQHEEEVAVNRLTRKEVVLSRGYKGQKPSWIKNWLYGDTEQRATSMFDTPFFNKIADIMNSEERYARDEKHFTSLYKSARKSKRGKSITPHGNPYTTANDVIASEVAAGDIITENQYVQRVIKNWKENKGEILFDLALTLLPYALNPAAGLASKIIRGMRMARQFQRIHSATSIPAVPKGQKTTKLTRKEYGFFAKDKPPPPIASFNGATPKGKADFSMKFGRATRGTRSPTGTRKPTQVKPPSPKKLQKVQAKKAKREKLIADKRKSAGKNIKDTFYKPGSKGFKKKIKQLRQFMKTAKTSAHIASEYNKVLELAAIEDKYSSKSRADVENQFVRFLFNVPEEFDFNSIKYARVQVYPGAAGDFINYEGDSVLPPDGYKWMKVKFKTKWAKEFVSDFLGPQDQTKRAYLSRLYWMDVYKEAASAMYLIGADKSIHYYKQTDLSKIPKDAGEKRREVGWRKSWFFDLAFEYYPEEHDAHIMETWTDYEEWEFFSIMRARQEDDDGWFDNPIIRDRVPPEGKVQMYIGECNIPPGCETEIKPDEKPCIVGKLMLRDQCKLAKFVEVTEHYYEMIQIGIDLRRAENIAVDVWCPWHDVPRAEKRRMFELGRCYTAEETRRAKIRTGLYTFERKGDIINVKKEYCADDESPFARKFTLGDELNMGSECFTPFELWYKFEAIYGDVTYYKLWGRKPINLDYAPDKPTGATKVVPVGKQGKVIGTFDPTDTTRRRRSVLSDMRGTRARHEDVLRAL